MSASWKCLSVFSLVDGLFLLTVPTAFPLCGAMVRTDAGGMVPMRCFYAIQALFLLALASLLTSGALFGIRESEARRLLGWFLMLLGGIVLIIPLAWAIGVCGASEAPCHLTCAAIFVGGALQLSAGGILSRLAVSQTTLVDGASGRLCR